MADTKWQVRNGRGVFVSEHGNSWAAADAAQSEANRSGLTTQYVEVSPDGVIGSPTQVSSMFHAQCVCGFTTNWYGTRMAAAEALAVHQQRCRRV